MAQSSTLEKLEGLKRRIDITVPASTVDQVYNQKIQKVANTAKIDGFRPGKIPQKVIQKQFGSSILIEAAQELIQSSLMSAVEEHKLQIAGTPSVTPKELKPGQALEFSAEFEVYPEISLADMAEVKLSRQVLELKDADIDKMLETLQKQHAEWVEVEREAANGDRVLIDFEGFINGEAFENGSAKDFQLELGSKQMIPGFEDGLIGVKFADEREITCAFPMDYPKNELAGQKATFKIHVNKVLAPKMPEINDEFAKKIGVEGGASALKKDVEKNMVSQVQQMLKDKLKKNMMDKLLDLNTITVPAALIDTEIEHLQQLAKQQMGENADKMPDNLFPRAHFEDQAVRRVSLGLILGEVIKQHQLKVDGQKVRERIEQIAAVYHDPAQVVNWYYNNKRMLAEVESVVLEDQAVEKLLKKCQTEDKKVSYDEAIKPPQEVGKKADKA